MRLRKFLVLGVVALGLVSSPAKAQDLQESLESMLKSNAQLYLQPFVDGFGSGMNSG